ncbi:MAG TPA: hypothetical protein VNY05_08120 [Candidatus Acidoferrales bacterium]|jgi:hypothetical protein|nr:hypothetical protein [Candidatus Acidoferrales bacterium]
MVIRLNSLFTITAVSFLGTLAPARAQAPDQITVRDLAGAHTALHRDGAHARAKMAAGTGTAADGPANPAAPAAAFPVADTIPSFNGQFAAKGFDPSGNPNNVWLYNMAGTPPKAGKTTTFNAPIIPVSLDLRDARGFPRSINGHPLFADATQYVTPVLNSPVFQNHQYTSADEPTQFTDAVQRASFGDDAKDDWHTLLKPAVKTARVMTLNQAPTCGPVGGFCTYQFALNPDGTCCLFVKIDFDTFINKLFPPTFPVDPNTVIGAAELAGDMTTQDISTLLFPNTFLFIGDPKNCCILGFHDNDVEPGIPSNGNRVRFYVMNFSSWISPGVFGGLADITALSHEMAETFADPFVFFDGVHNITPWWLSPNGNCQDTLEVGDVIEGLPNQTFPIAMHGFTYHPQNEALLPWFTFQKPFEHDGQKGYSYPDLTVLTALSPLEKAGCVK